MIPELNKEYNCYDDGKITTSRHYTVTVKEVIPFEQIDSITLERWKQEVKECYWLYKETTDYFIKTITTDNEEHVFVRTKDDRWFSIGGFLNDGVLDIDNTLTEALKERDNV